MSKILPVIVPNKSDSASMDMVVELLLMTGRSLPEVMMMLVPEAWEKHNSMDDDKKAFYEYNSCIMEPWDGPASIPFTDGKYMVSGLLKLTKDNASNLTPDPLYSSNYYSHPPIAERIASIEKKLTNT